MTEYTPETAVTEEERNPDIIAVEINSIREQTAKIVLSAAIQIGERLCEAKELLKHGEWGAWLKEKVSYSQATAERLMKVYRGYATEQKSLFGAEVKSAALQNLSISNALLLLDIPAGEREDFAAENDVQNLSTREMERLLRERDEAVRRAEDAEHAKSKAEQDELNAQKEKAELENELMAARDTIHELENRPVDVAVQEPDPEEMQRRIDGAVAEAMKEAKAAAAAEKKKLKDKLSAAETAKKELEAEAEKLRKDAADKDRQLEAQASAGATAEEKERLEREIEILRKQLAMSDAEVTTFKTLFDQWRRLFAQMTEHLRGMTDAETAAKLRAALRKQTEAYGEAAKE